MLRSGQRKEMKSPSYFRCLCQYIYDSEKELLSSVSLMMIIYNQDKFVHRFYWQRNGLPVDMDEGGRVRFVSPDQGTLTISSTDIDDDGTYQCFAVNQFGTAVSSLAMIRKAGGWVTGQNVPSQNVQGEKYLAMG